MILCNGTFFILSCTFLLNLTRFSVWWSHAHDFLEITNSSDYERVWTAKLSHLMKSWHCGLGNCFSCLKFEAHTLLWYQEFVSLKNLEHKFIKVVVIITIIIIASLSSSKTHLVLCFFSYWVYYFINGCQEKNIALSNFSVTSRNYQSNSESSK